MPEASPLSAERVRCHLAIQGRVQGVGFRYYAAQQARALGLGGFVRNLANRLEAEVEGPREVVLEFITRIRRGPAGAVVRAVEVQWVDPRGEEAFRIG